MNTHKEFAAKLNAALADKGWSQSELARRAGLRRDAISTYCRGTAVPSSESLEKLARALDWSASPSPLTITSKNAKPRSHRIAGFDLQQDTNGFRLRLDVVTTLEQAMEILALLKSDTRTDFR
jgi:transcriptional regulator with XRE-family HTH domain